MQNLDRNSATVKKKLKYNGRAIENKTLPDICAVIYDMVCTYMIYHIRL